MHISVNNVDIIKENSIVLSNTFSKIAVISCAAGAVLILIRILHTLSSKLLRKKNDNLIEMTVERVNELRTSSRIGNTDAILTESKYFVHLRANDNTMYQCEIGVETFASLSAYKGKVIKVSKCNNGFMWNNKFIQCKEN